MPCVVRRCALVTADPHDGFRVRPGRANVARRLAAHYARTAALEAALAADLDGIIRSTAGANADDEHDPEGATIAFERAQAQALLEHTRTHLVDLSAAMARLDDGSYGVCLGCGSQIAGERLEARPSASVCIGCAR